MPLRTRAQGQLPPPLPAYKLFVQEALQRGGGTWEAGALSPLHSRISVAETSVSPRMPPGSTRQSSCRCLRVRSFWPVCPQQAAQSCHAQSNHCWHSSSLDVACTMPVSGSPVWASPGHLLEKLGAGPALCDSNLGEPRCFASTTPHSILLLAPCIEGDTEAGTERDLLMGRGAGT